MTKRDQKAFARNLTTSVCKEFCRLVVEGKVPEKWDGFEIREWLAEKFDANRMGTMRVKRGERAGEYRRVVVTTPGL